jgi:hypothetical protein
VDFNRMSLGLFFKEFQNSAALFELLERGGGPPTVGIFGGVFVQFRIIAARDAAMNLFHFRSSLQGLTRQIPHCPSYGSSQTLGKISGALVRFDQYFPKTDNIRNAIAHAGQLNNAPSKMKGNEQRKQRRANGIESGPGGIFLHGLFERTYTIGKSGKLLSLQVDGSSIMKIAETVQLVNSAFASP